ncbi:MAG TPA: acetyl-CoA carboxylase biotin carboxyl carrier protein [Kofleriaceae bacterium]|nr:acetyl-CoA carboxylase biotin carboxyl carrier protein [Kofleriaceae bacterium]
MATGRKGPTAPPPRKRPSDTGAPDEVDGAAASAGPPEDLVAVVRGLAAAVADHGLTELIVDTPEVTFTLRRGGVATVTMPALPPQLQAMPTMPSISMPSPQLGAMPSMSMPAIPVPTMPMASAGGGASNAALAVPPVAAAAEEKTHLVTSPFVGTFYRRPNPDAPEYAKVNDKVGKGQVLCIIEAMKLMNEIEADVAGTIVGVLAEDGAPVEYGQPLFRIAVA